MSTYVPSQTDCRIIRETALQLCIDAQSADGITRSSQLALDPAIRCSLDDLELASINAATISCSDDPMSDTQAIDVVPWERFQKGFELTPEGKGLVDFYVSRKNNGEGDLRINVQAHIRDGKLARVASGSHGYNMGGIK